MLWYKRTPILQGDGYLLHNAETELEKLVKSNDRLILLVGTGISRAISCDPSSMWKGWLEKGVNFANDEVKSKVISLISEKSSASLINAAELLKGHLKKSQRYFDWMDCTIGALQPVFPAPAKCIGKLMEQDTVVLTTNYDVLLESVIGAKTLSYYDKKEILGILRGGKTDSVIHIHGYYQNKPDSSPFDNTIASVDDYSRLLSDETAQFLQRWFASGPIIYIGCGATFEDPNIGSLLRWVTSLDVSITHYALVREGEMIELPKNVLPVFYGCTYSDLPTYLESLSTLRLDKNIFSFGFKFEKDGPQDKEWGNSNIVNLSFSSQWVPFCGNKDNIKTIMDFCKQDGRFLWAVVSGPAGSGKSRLVLECTKQLPTNWQAFFLEKAHKRYDVEYNPRSDTFIAIDYVVGREKEISLFMSDIYRRFLTSTNKLRIILIERSNDTHTGSWYNMLKFSSDTYQWRKIMECMLGSGQRMSLIHLGDMDEKTSISLIRQVFNAMGYRSKQDEDIKLYTCFKSVFQTRFRRPLFIQIVAIGWAENKESWKGLTDVTQIYDWILDREEYRWKSILDRSLPVGVDQQEIYDNWKEIVCYTAINGSLPIYRISNLPERLQSMISELFHLIGGKREDNNYYQRISHFLCDMLGSNEVSENFFSPPYIDKIHIEWPDIITEYMFLRFIDRNHKRIKAFSDMSIKIDEKSSMAFLHKLEQDFPYDKTASEILTQYSDISSVLYSNSKSDLYSELPKPLDHETQEKLIERMIEGDQRAKAELIEHSLGLVKHVIKKFSSGDNDHDLMSIGVIGLIKATNAFMLNGKTRFATYATRCIENELLMYMRSQMKKSKQVNILGNSAEKEPSILDKLVVEDDILEYVSQSTILDRVKKYINTYLNTREKEVLDLRYGLNGKSFTQREVAMKLKVSRSFELRIEKSAINKLQRAIDSGLLNACG